MSRLRAPARPVLAVVLVCGVVLGPFAANFAIAQDGGDVEDLRQEREDNRRNAADVAAELDELSAQDDELIAAIAVIDAHITLQESRIAASEQSIADAEQRAAGARAEADALATEMDGIRERLSQRAVEVFVAPPLDALEQLNSDDLLEAELKRTYVDEALGNEYQLIAQLRTAEAAQAEAGRVAVEAAAGGESLCFNRIFYREPDMIEQHHSILRGIYSRYQTPFFSALKLHSRRPIGVFHAMPLSRGKSIFSSNWIQDLAEFYGRNIFMAETSATSNPSDRPR